MAAPTTAFKSIANSLATTALDTAGERKTAFNAGTTVDNSGANPLDFGTVSIAGSVVAVRSGVKHLMWGVTAWGANVNVSNFRGWFDTSGGAGEGFGFDQANTKLKAVALKYESGGTNGTLYVQNAVETSYGGHATWVPGGLLHQSTAPAQNLWAGTGGTNFSSSADDVVGMQALLEVDPAETAGVYLGSTAGYEFRMSVRYDYN